jgi:hypothetical protein
MMILAISLVNHCQLIIHNLHFFVVWLRKIVIDRWYDQREDEKILALIHPCLLPQYSFW